MNATAHESHPGVLPLIADGAGQRTTSPRVSHLTWNRARFSECDVNGHVNNVALIGMVEQAGLDLLTASGYSLTCLRTRFEASLVVRGFDVSFHQPAMENDVLFTRCTCLCAEGARAKVSCEIRRVKGDPWNLPPARMMPFSAPNPAPDSESDLIVLASTQYVFVSLVRQRPVRIPSEVRAAFFEQHDQFPQVMAAD